MELAIESLELLVNVSIKSILLALVVALAIRCVSDINIKHRGVVGLLTCMLAMPWLVWLTPNLDVPVFSQARGTNASSEPSLISNQPGQASPAVDLDFENSLAKSERSERSDSQMSEDVSQRKAFDVSSSELAIENIDLPHAAPAPITASTGVPWQSIGDIRPQEFRHRIDTPTLRGVNVQRLFGSQRALKSIEDFSEFEQRAAYFDGDHVIAAKKGVNALERGSQVHSMAEFQAILDFPPAPKLNLLGKLDESKATESELRGQAIFHGKAQCAECHAAPYYTDNLMHNLKAERFFEPKMINGRMASADGPIKTFPLRGIKDSPPYMHDGRLLTLEDTVEFHNLVLETKLSEQEKQDLVVFLRCL